MAQDAVERVLCALALAIADVHRQMHAEDVIEHIRIAGVDVREQPAVDLDVESSQSDDNLACAVQDQRLAAKDVRQRLVRDGNPSQSAADPPINEPLVFEDKYRGTDHLLRSQFNTRDATIERW